jgi:hypothetical protein
MATVIISWYASREFFIANEAERPSVAISGATQVNATPTFRGHAVTS